MIRHVAVNATRYDKLPSGARNRAVGIVATLLRRDVRVSVQATPQTGSGLRAAIETELGADPAGRLDIGVREADGADLLVTDYHPVHRQIPTAVTVHDLRTHALRSERRTVRGLARHSLLGPIARRAALVVTPTRAVGDECTQRLDVDPARIAVVPNGLSRPWCEGGDWEGGGPFVWIGPPDPRKGFDMLCAALSAAAESGPVRPLVVVGRERERFEAIVRAHPPLVARGLVDCRGVLTDGEIVGLVRGATAVVHPSRYEGFGMTVLEALSLGAPVLAGDCAAVREVAGAGVALLDCNDRDAWTAALLAASSGDAPAPDRRTVARARSFTWDAAAEALVAAAERSLAIRQ